MQAAFARLRLCLSLALSLSRFSRRLRLPGRRERTRAPMLTERGTYPRVPNLARLCDSVSSSATLACS